MRRVLIFLLLLTACNSVLIEPGHVTPEMRYKLRVWMTHDQVREVLGAPLVGNEANTPRWEYLYHTKEYDHSTGQLGNPVVRKLVVYFDGDRMLRADDGVTQLAAPTQKENTLTTQPSMEASTPRVEAAVEANPIKVLSPLPLDPMVSPPIPSYQTGVLVDPDRTDDVRDALENWYSAWETQDLQHYLASYSKGFKPAGKMSHKAWEAQRKKRIAHVESMSIEIEDLTIKMLDKTHAQTLFKQTYHSEQHHDVVHKTLDWVLENNEWLIVSELTDAE